MHTLHNFHPLSNRAKAGLWKTEGAPTATLVVAAGHRPADPNTLLEVAQDLAVTRFAESNPRKVAAIWPGHNDVHYEYLFGQLVETPDSQLILDTNAECGHSLVASVAHARSLSTLRTTTQNFEVRSLRSGSIVTCVAAGAANASSGQYDVWFPFAPESTSFPLGQAPVTVDVEGLSLETVIVNSGNPYVFVDTRDIGVTESTQFFERNESALKITRSLRKVTAPLLELPIEGALPKIALVTAGKSSEVLVRAVATNTWHPTFALTGYVALATAMTGSAQWFATRDMHIDNQRFSVRHAVGLVENRIDWRHNALGVWVYNRISNRLDATATRHCNCSRRLSRPADSSGDSIACAIHH